MDLSSAFRSEVFRPVATIAIPGATAVGPYILIARHYHQFVSNAWEHHPNLSGVVLAFVVIGAGMILEDLGSQIEIYWDRHSTTPFAELEAEWYRYLLLVLAPEPIAQRYLRTITLRLKFELGMGTALPIMWVGLTWLGFATGVWSIVILPACVSDLLPTTWFDWTLLTVCVSQAQSLASFAAFTALVVLLTGYLLYESRLSAERLVGLRRKILAKPGVA